VEPLVSEQTESRLDTSEDDALESEDDGEDPAATLGSAKRISDTDSSSSCIIFFSDFAEVNSTSDEVDTTRV